MNNPAQAWGVVHDVAAQHNLSVEFVEFEQMSFHEQRRKMCTTRLLVTQHGAAVGHILWSTSPSRAVLELPPILQGWWRQVMLPNDVAYFAPECRQNCHANGGDAGPSDRAQMWGQHSVETLTWSSRNGRNRTSRMLTIDVNQLRKELARAILAVMAEDGASERSQRKAAAERRRRSVHESQQLIQKAWRLPHIAVDGGALEGASLVYSATNASAWNHSFRRPAALNWYRGGGHKFGSNFRSGAVVCEAAEGAGPRCAMFNDVCIEACLSPSDENEIQQCIAHDAVCKGGCMVKGCRWSRWRPRAWSSGGSVR